MSAKVRWGSYARGTRRHREVDASRSGAHIRQTVTSAVNWTRSSSAGVSIQTTERYLGWKQKLRHAVNDQLEIEPDLA